jgi:endonuclease/exonuclease/phosphatase (EEP) superfamily protein YafD
LVPWRRRPSSTLTPDPGAPQTTPWQLQINLHHCEAASVNLMRLTENPRPDVVYVQEPYTLRGKPQYIPAGYDAFLCNLTPRQPRALIFASKALNAWFREDLSSSDQCVIQSKCILRGKTVTAASVYFPGDAEVISPEFNKLVQNCASRKSELLVAGDINAHHTHWGSKSVNARGEELLTYVCASDLLFCNRGGTPTFNI